MDEINEGDGEVGLTSLIAHTRTMSYVILLLTLMGCGVMIALISRVNHTLPIVAVSLFFCSFLAWNNRNGLVRLPVIIHAMRQGDTYRRSLAMIAAANLLSLAIPVLSVLAIIVVVLIAL